MAVWKKLVRDRIPEIIRASNEIPVTRILDAPEFVDALKAKLLEEADELIHAQDIESVIAEAADVLEVVQSLCAANGVALEHVVALQDKKRAERGGFKDRIYLVETRPI